MSEIKGVLTSGIGLATTVTAIKAVIARSVEIIDFNENCMMLIAKVLLAKSEEGEFV